MTAIAEQLRLIGKSLTHAAEELAVVVAHLGAWPSNVELPPKPRRPPVRQYMKIKLGDTVVVAERHRARTPSLLRTARLAVVAVDDDLITVQISGGEPTRYALERRVLVITK